MMAGYAAPVGDTGRAVLVSAGISAVGVALSVAYENGDIAVVDVFVHEHRVASAGAAQIDHVLGVLAVVARYLPAPVEFSKELLAEYFLHLRYSGPRVKTVGEKKKDVVLVHAGGIELVKAGTYGHSAVRGRLGAALHDVRNDEDYALAGTGDLAQRLHADGSADALERSGIKAVPVLRQTGGIGHRFPGDENIRAVGKLRGHETLAVFEFELFHLTFAFLHLT